MGTQIHRTEQEVETSVLDGIAGQVGKTLDWIQHTEVQISVLPPITHATWRKSLCFSIGGLMVKVQSGVRVPDYLPARLVP